MMTMNTLTKRLFISYPRKDGKPAAYQLHDRLAALGFDVWLDKEDLIPGSDWWQEIVNAIHTTDFMLVIMTPATLESKVMREEWRHARQEGVCVVPVDAGLGIDYEKIPRWMRDYQFVSVEDNDGWEMLLKRLRTPYKRMRVPFMAEDTPADYVPRPEKIEALIELLLDPQREDPVAITAALRGAGGYGKTTLARAICHDARIVNAFKHGILWVTLGEKPGDLLGKVEDMIAILSGERPGHASLEAAIMALTEELDGRDLLMVIDDVWDSAHLTPFLQGGKRCARLITTRMGDILPAHAPHINVDQMEKAEAVALLSAGLKTYHEPSFRALARRLGEWPLLLKLVNSVLHDRLDQHAETLKDALHFINQSLDEGGLTVFDNPNNPKERSRAVRATMQVSLNLLERDQQRRFSELAIFPKSIDIPLATVARLWGTTGIYTPNQTERFCNRLDKLSLLLRYDPVTGRIRLHDVVHDFLQEDRNIMRADVHRQFLQSYKIKVWADLPSTDPYIWDWLAFHLVEAGQADELVSTVRDLRYLAAKSIARGPHAAEADLVRAENHAPNDMVLRSLRRSFAHSGHLLNARSSASEVSMTLFTRLQHLPELRSICQKLERSLPKPYPRALAPLPDLPRGALIRVLSGHNGPVRDCEISATGEFIVSASADNTLKVWDARTGAERRTLTGHTQEVNGCAISEGGPNGDFIASVSADRTVKIWSVHTGELLKTLEGHTNVISDCSISPDGTTIASVSADKSIKLWDVQSGSLIRSLEGHTGWVSDCAISPDGSYIVSASADKSLKIWDMRTGALRRTLTGHGDSVHGCAISSDGARIASASRDKTLRVWDSQSGAHLLTLTGHTSVVDDCAFDADRVMSASDDCTLRVWNARSGALRKTLTGHTGWVNRCAIRGDMMVSASDDCTLRIWDINEVALQDVSAVNGHSHWVYDCSISPVGEFAVSASSDRTLIQWNLKTDDIQRSYGGHAGPVRACAISPRGEWIASASDDKQVMVWDARSGKLHRKLLGHMAWVRACAFSPDGRYLVSASNDTTLKYWDIETGDVIHTLRGHNDWITGCAAGSRMVASASRDNTLRLWDAASGSLLRVIHGPNEGLLTCAISQTGDFVTSTSQAGVVHVWDTHSGQERTRLVGHTGAVPHCAISPAGDVIYTASLDKTLRAWDARTGKSLFTLLVDAPLRACAIHPDGRRLMAAGDSGVYFFEVMR